MSTPRPWQEWFRKSDGARVLVCSEVRDGTVHVQIPPGKVGGEVLVRVEDLYRPAPRMRNVQHVRDQIASGRYMSARKLDYVAEVVAREMNRMGEGA